MNWELIVKLVILAVAGIIFGYVLGRRSSYTYGGDIVFEKYPDDHEKCIFKLEHDEIWLGQQRYVLFKIKHTIGTEANDDTEEELS